MAIWKARLKDGREISELNSKWEDVKDNIVDLLMITNSNQIISLPKNMDSYIQFKTASAEMSNGNIEIESRVIGYIQRNNIVKIRVNEKTNNISVEIK